jgi:small subunit ribosomal protein S2
MKDLLEAGIHFGHHARRWNPRMQPYIFGVRNNVHIMDLQQTLPMFDHALKALRDIVAKGGKVLFVGTKRQAQALIKETALRCGQHYVNHRWLGGMMTNWNTISGSIRRLSEIEKILENQAGLSAYTKKEILMMTRERDKLMLSVGGIREMGGRPDAVVIIDVNQEDIAVQEANKLGIPVFAVVDSNASPAGIDYIIPGNDDALRAIEFYCTMFADAVLDGLHAELSKAGVDTGAAVDVEVQVPEQAAAAEEPAEEAAEESKKAASA